MKIPLLCLAAVLLCVCAPCVVKAESTQGDGAGAIDLCAFCTDGLLGKVAQLLILFAEKIFAYADGKCEHFCITDGCRAECQQVANATLKDAMLKLDEYETRRAICDFVGLCEEGEAPARAQQHLATYWRDAGSNDACSACKGTLKHMADEIDGLEDPIMGFGKKGCSAVCASGPCEAACMQLFVDGLKMVLEQLDNSTTEQTICAFITLCEEGGAGQLPHPQLEQAVLNVDEDEDYCEWCTDNVYNATQTLNSSEPLISAALCGTLCGGDANCTATCLQSVSLWVANFVDKFADYEYEKEMCAYAGLCRPVAAAQPANVPVDAAPADNELLDVVAAFDASQSGTQVCDVCIEAVDSAYAGHKAHTTERVKSTLARACDKLGTLAPACSSAVAADFDKAIGGIEQRTYPAAHICHVLFAPYC